VYLEFPTNQHAATKTRDFFEKELRTNLIAPTIVLTEFMKLSGAVIGQEAAKNRIRLLKERGLQIADLNEQHALTAGTLLLSHGNIPIADAIIASYVKSGEADYVLTDDPHFQTLNVKTKWIP
jgi:predicted nucleic acid-binding protein